MTPKEKAEKLIQRFRSINFETGQNSKMIASTKDCAQCAIVCVNEILMIVGDDEIEFFNQVKTELIMRQI